MSRIRELWAGAIQSSHLEPDSEHENAIDRIGGAAFGPALGRTLWRIKLAEETHLATVALAMLVATMRRRWNLHPRSDDSRIAHQIGRQALTEWYSPNCRVCGGAGEVDDGELRMACQTCEGEGIHNYTEQERRVAVLGPKPDPAWERVWSRRLVEALAHIHAMDAAVGMEMQRQLERGGPRE